MLIQTNLFTFAIPSLFRTKNKKAVNSCSQRLAFMMNESKTIREFPRAVRFPIAVWFQEVSVE